MPLSDLSWGQARAAGHTRDEWIVAVRQVRPGRHAHQRAPTRTNAHQLRANQTEPKRTEPNNSANSQPQPTDDDWCIHRQPQVGSELCGGCRGTVRLKVYGCRVHSQCTIGVNIGKACCDACGDRQTEPREQPFAHLANIHLGEAAVVVGAGRTDFDYRQLIGHRGPIAFINMAASAEQWAHPATATYFFALDRRQSAYLPYFRGAAVLAVGPQFREQDIAKAATLIRWRNTPKGAEHLLQLSRAQMAISHELYRGKAEWGGTVHPTLHFLWYAGVTHVKLVGCDGLPGGYDPRLTNRIGQTPDMVQDGTPRSLDRFARFREHQEWEMTTLGMTWEYVGTPPS